MSEAVSPAPPLTGFDLWTPNDYSNFITICVSCVRTLDLARLPSPSDVVDTRRLAGLAGLDPWISWISWISWLIAPGAMIFRLGAVCLQELSFGGRWVRALSHAAAPLVCPHRPPDAATTSLRVRWPETVSVFVVSVFELWRVSFPAGFCPLARAELWRAVGTRLVPRRCALGLLRSAT